MHEANTSGHTLLWPRDTTRHLDVNVTSKPRPCIAQRGSKPKIKPALAPAVPLPGQHPLCLLLAFWLLLRRRLLRLLRRLPSLCQLPSLSCCR